MAVVQRKSTFSFDLSKPVKRGSLYKQGALHKAFKVREFILYPGFLVYYENENKWRLDLTKGETLGNRQGAVKLKGATVSIARNAPKACKYGLMLTAPDPANKRQSYLMNAYSKEDRDQWIEAIRKATPVSPHMPRKNLPSGGTAATSSDPPKSSVTEKEKAPKDKKEEELAPPSYTMRQDTACDAALAAATCTDNAEEQRAIEEVITSVNSSLKDVPPALITRHDTATMAALSLGREGEGPLGQQLNGLDEEEEEGHETNIDSIFGKQENSEDESTSEVSSTSTATPIMSPEPADATEMDTTTKVVENGEGSEGAVITTTVTVACSSNCNSQECSPILGARHRGEEERAGGEEGEGKKEEGEKGEVDSPALTTGKPRTASSTQILLNDCEENTKLCVNLNGYDSDDTLSDEESHTNLEDLQAEDFQESKTNGITYEPPIPYAKKEEGSSEQSSSPSRSPAIGIKEDRTGKGSPSPPRSPEAGAKKEDKGSEDKGSSSPSRSPVIGIKEDRTGKGSVSSKDSRSSDEMTRLSPPVDKKRSNSVPFIEKKGYLYKMGGQRKTWKLRYFVLRPGVFNYFKDSQSSKPIAEVKLKNLSIFFPGIGERKQSFQFTVHTESSWNKRPNWVLAGQSEREMKEWITAFKAAGQKVASFSPHDSDSG